MKRAKEINMKCANVSLDNMSSFLVLVQFEVHLELKQALPGMACDRSRTPWRTPSLSKECDKSHALPFQTRVKILYFSVTICQSGSTKSKILNDLIVIIKIVYKR